MGSSSPLELPLLPLRDVVGALSEGGYDGCWEVELLGEDVGYPLAMHFQLGISNLVTFTVSTLKPFIVYF